MHFIRWLYLIIETLHKLCTIIPKYLFIEEYFFQRKSKKWERYCSFIPNIKWNIPRYWKLTSALDIIDCCSPRNPALWHTIHQTNLLHLIDNNTLHWVSPQIYMSSVRSPNSAPSNILSPLSTRENEFYIIKSSFVRN